ncbi:MULTISPECIES: LysR family transcriptional regulator [Oceanobacillus]|uniref:LysR family transcriptional regulator n=1 Tax=Oceanobacillus TaxID=182709 RepID=UPI0030DADFC1
MNQIWLEAYIAIVEEKSITRAANRLNISQPALSKQVRSLEADVNTKLLTRSSKGIELTKAGQYFYQQAQSLLQETNRTREKLMKMQQTDKLTIGCLPSQPLFSRMLLRIILFLFRIIQKRLSSQ